MRMTIKARILVMGLVAIVAMSVVAGLSLWSSLLASGAMERREALRVQLQTTTEMRITAEAVAGAAVSALIIDRPVRAVHPDRERAIKEGLRGLRDAIDNLAAAAELETSATDSLSVLLGPIEQTAAEDLFPLITNGASELEFEALAVQLAEENTAFHDALLAIADQLSAEMVAAREDTQAAVELTKTVTLVAYAGAAVVLAGLLYVIGVSIVTGLSGVLRQIRILAEGSIDLDIAGQDRGDEIGEIAQSLEIFKQNIGERRRLVAEQRTQQEDNLRERTAEMTALADAFEKQVGRIMFSVSDRAETMRGTAGTLVDAANESDGYCSHAASASHQATTNVRTVAERADDLARSIAEVSQQVERSAAIARGAVDEVGESNAKVESLAEATQKIGEVVRLINEIAGQTNLLALNATIEAARAGEAGKGFAVVASEVKSLANQTARATEEITQQISGIQQASQEAEDAISGIGGTINKVNEIATAIAAAMEQQGLATREIARNVQEAASGTQDVSKTMEAMTQASSATGSAAESVLEAADSLTRQCEELSQGMDKFLANIRAA